MLASLLSNPDVQTLLFSAAAGLIGWIAARRKAPAPTPSPAPPGPTPVPSPISPTPAPGSPLDYNGDGVVDARDLLAVLQTLLVARRQSQAHALLTDLVQGVQVSPVTPPPGGKE